MSFWWSQSRQISCLDFSAAQTFSPWHIIAATNSRIMHGALCGSYNLIDLWYKRAHFKKSCRWIQTPFLGDGSIVQLSIIGIVHCPSPGMTIDLFLLRQTAWIRLWTWYHNFRTIECHLKPECTSADLLVCIHSLFCECGVAWSTEE